MGASAPPPTKWNAAVGFRARPRQRDASWRHNAARGPARAKLRSKRREPTDRGGTMKVCGTHFRTIWTTESGTVRVIDQSRLPFEFFTRDLETVADAVHAIRTMVVRGAPLIGATAAYGMALGTRANPSDAHLAEAARMLQATRPTAINLAWALRRMRKVLAEVQPKERAAVAFREAAAICDADVEQCRMIGVHGLEVVRGLAVGAGRQLNILTHCNAGWLACVDWGTALAPVYMAHDAGIPVHVWVDETRPRNQGAALTAFELGAHGVPHTVVTDNLGGHLMQRGQVDMVIVGSDRTTAGGEVCNKVGTYLKALAARDNGVPFYAALPVSTIDWSLQAGSAIPIEERSPDEVTHITGRNSSGQIETVRLVPDSSTALNLAFDVTPARLVTGLITERGVCSASRMGLQRLYPDLRAAE
jgi:methylthioribose-1-phosphate isomerase